MSPTYLKTCLDQLKTFTDKLPELPESEDKKTIKALCMACANDILQAAFAIEQGNQDRFNVATDNAEDLLYCIKNNIKRALR